MSRAALTLPLLALLAACAGTAGDAPRGAPPDCVFTEDGLLPLRDASGVVVAAQIDGRALAMELNTGLGLTSLQPEVAERLRLPEDPRAQSSYRGPGGAVIARRNLLPRSLRVGGQDWTGRSIAQRPFYGSGGGRPGFDGVIGMDLLRDTELDLDLPRRRVALHRARGCRLVPPWPGAAGAVLELSAAGVPSVSARVNGQMVRARIHTGNNRSVMSERLARQLALSTPTGQQGRAYGASPDARPTREFRLDELALGQEVLRDQTVVVVPGGAEEEDLTLGRDWLERRRVWLSFPGRRIFLAPL